jgi:sodium/proline symporter
MHDFLTSDQAPVSITFAVFILLFLGVGIYSGLQKEDTTQDYLLANRSVNPWLTALSSMATGNSGFMFIGLIGFTYQVGLAAIWLTFGWLIGDWIAWFVVHRRLREVSEEVDTETVSAFLGQDLELVNNSVGAAVAANSQAGRKASMNRWITVLAALITLGFLGAYAAAQLQAGSKALNVIFGWDYSIGILLGAVVVGIYCLTGGLRASIWIGSIQAVIMVISMIVLVTVAVIASGGVDQLIVHLREIDPTLLHIIPENLRFGFLPFLLGWFVAGFGVVGQPHIMVRAMAIDSAENVKVARNIYLGLQAAFATTAIAVGLASRVLLPDLMAAGSDVELALPELANQLLPGLLVGLVLAGLFSATLSTADAQILSCSAALTQDIFPRAAGSYLLAKIGTVVTMLIILVIALLGSDSVFTLVTFAWAALAAGLGPLMVVRAFQRPVHTFTGISMMLLGIGIALLWRFGLHWSDAVYEVLPGMLTSALAYLTIQPLMQCLASEETP